MGQSRPERSSHLRLRPTAAGEFLPPANPPLPLYHHPVVAISLILSVGSLAQICVWLLASRLPPPVLVPHSSLIAHGWLFEQLVALLTRLNPTETASPPLLFPICLAIALLSGPAWYMAARLALGHAWGLWVGLCWVAHPAFAFLAQHPTTLVMILTFLPLAWALLVWWHRRRRRWMAALAALGLALLTSVSLLGVVLLLPSAVSMLSTGRRKKKWSGAAILMVTYALAIAPLVYWFSRPASLESLRHRVTSDLWSRLDSGDGSSLSSAVQAWRVAHPGAALDVREFVKAEIGKSPLRVAGWFGERVWKSIHATADGRLERPLLVAQLALVLPAAWGWLVAFGFNRWRWVASTALTWSLVVWTLAALSEPLARNVVPAGGFGVMFALVGLADVYERIFGRRLTGDQKPSGPGGVLRRGGPRPGVAG